MGPGLRAQGEMLGEPVPALEFFLVENDLPGSLLDFQGQVVVVNVWATWCPPCIAEMADLDRLQQTWGKDGLVVLHLSDEDRETLVAWLAERPAVTVPAYAQPIPWPETGRPTTYLVDREGTLVFAARAGTVVYFEDHWPDGETRVGCPACLATSG